MLTNSMSLLASHWAAPCCTSFMSLVLLLLHTTWKWPILLHSVHIFPSICQALSWGMAASAIPACLLHWHSHLYGSSQIVFAHILRYFYLIKFFCLCKTVHYHISCSLHLYSFGLCQYIFTCDDTAYLYFC